MDQNGQLIPIRDPSTNAPFPGNIVPGNRIDPKGQALLNLFPLPTTVDPAHTYNSVFQRPIDQPRNDQILRMDWNIAPGTTFYARGIKDYQATRGRLRIRAGVAGLAAISGELRDPVPGNRGNAHPHVQPEADQRGDLRSESREFRGKGR